MNGGRIVKHKKHDNDILVQIKCFGKYVGRDQGEKCVQSTLRGSAKWLIYIGLLSIRRLLSHAPIFICFLWTSSTYKPLWKMKIKRHNITQIMQASDYKIFPEIKTMSCLLSGIKVLSKSIPLILWYHNKHMQTLHYTYCGPHSQQLGLRDPSPWDCTGTSEGEKRLRNKTEIGIQN